MAASTFREDWAAQNLHFMGSADEARQAAAAALFRLKGLRMELGEDYRVDLAEARVRAIQGAEPGRGQGADRKSNPVGRRRMIWQRLKTGTSMHRFLRSQAWRPRRLICLSHF